MAFFECTGGGGAKKTDENNTYIVESWTSKNNYTSVGSTLPTQYNNRDSALILYSSTQSWSGWDGSTFTPIAGAAIDSCTLVAQIARKGGVNNAQSHPVALYKLKLNSNSHRGVTVYLHNVGNTSYPTTTELKYII